MRSNGDKQGVPRTAQVFFLLVVLSAGIFYGENIRAAETMKVQSIQDVPHNRWQRLAEGKIFFGHQSVGNNIVKGLLELQKQQPYIKLNIVKTHEPDQFSAPIFAHDMIGKNTDPYSKIQAFDELIRNGIGTRADIVFFKFCFVDVVRKTDIRDLFEKYKTMVGQLQKEYPDLTIVHCTVPLQVHKRTWKSYLKNAMSLTSWKYTDNVRRNEFNTMLLNEYGDSVFNLALFEATRQDGSLVRFKGSGGKDFLALNPDYSSDGAHLNTLGSRFIAQQLLLFLGKEM